MVSGMASWLSSPPTLRRAACGQKSAGLDAVKPEVLNSRFQSLAFIAVMDPVLACRERVFDWDHFSRNRPRLAPLPDENL